MKKELNQFWRLITAIIYITFMFILFNFVGGGLKEIVNFNEDISLWFYSGALLIILGTYITEPFFTKPTDTITNTISLTIALLAIKNKNALVGYNIIITFVIVMFVLSIIAIIIKNKSLKISKINFWIVKNLGSSKILFSLIYLSSSYSYFANEKYMKFFIIALVIWMCITFFDIVGISISKLISLFKIIKYKNNNEILGNAIDCKNSFLYNIEVNNEKIKLVKVGDVVSIQKEKGKYNVGIIIDFKELLSKSWIDIYILQSNNEAISFNKKELNIDNEYEINKGDYLEVRKLDIETIDDNCKKKICDNDFYKNIDRFIGFIVAGSNINTVKIAMIRKNKNININIKEGSIIKTKIYNQETLYQIIDGITKEESLEENNSSSFILVIARKLGKYDRNKKELNHIEWVPSPYEPVYLIEFENINDEETEIAQNCIGRLPNTNMGIPILEPDFLVTHNTAILGILGIGKSCLAYELIKKVLLNETKIICIDITNQYYSPNGLLYYLENNIIQNELLEKDIINLKSTSTQKGIPSAPSGWGNQEVYKTIIKTQIKDFDDSDKKILILNPEKHIVNKALNNFNISETVELTVVEKTKIISESILAYAMSKGQSDKGKYLIVYEEAHSLIPEWNSASNSSDQTSSNGIAKVILQGRKYGLGCFVITQRTANVSKSILNQCNTIFALRIFDDTGKAFLENYIGQDYSSVLSTLEERHAIAIGKALKLKQPIILQLNNKIFLKLEQDCINIKENIQDNREEIIQDNIDILLE